MSEFAEKLKSLSESSAAPMGFHPAVSEAKSPSMLLVVGLAGTQVKEAKIVTEVHADAGFILSEGTSAQVVRQMIEAAGNVPVGILVKGMSQKEIDELASLGCDFVVFDIKGAAAILGKKEVGKFLMIEPSLDQGLVRAINSLEVDGVFVNGGGDAFVAVEHLLVCRRFVELLDKPIVMMLPSLATKEELTGLWQVGVDGVVAPSGQSSQALTELKRMTSDLPRGSRGRRAKASVQLPHYGGGVVGEEDEQEERSSPDPFSPS
jgi:hypothetical protein